ncbi:hypothetical protein D8I24_3094 (plasmid) [Cupriavidus necator H850]|uniref:hypothetical protein n=1 Tax=Cupriavidus necator TaxID=106590 RepID=UPI001E557BDB|nr:hypothetical protein [Cupriavidus necator]KAI3602916.1 hypothetical protein D8I24_3094 [Cupriavidus necator H850]
MTDFYQTLHQEAKALFQPFHGTPEALIALAHAGFRAWAKAGNLNFPEEKRYALLHEVLRYCADQCLLACCFSQEHRLRDIAAMLDGRYPPYALTRARVSARHDRYGRPFCEPYRLNEAANVVG